jgi:hypothetical protein
MDWRVPRLKPVHPPAARIVCHKCGRYEIGDVDIHDHCGCPPPVQWNR